MRNYLNSPIGQQPEPKKKRTKTGPAHGTSRKYGLGCHCDVCTDANTARSQEARAKRVARPLPEGIVHGESTYRNWNCQCDVCKQANRDRLNRNHAQAGPGVNRGKEWTDTELKVALERVDGRRYKRTALQAAKELGRSVSAVYAQRSGRTVESEIQPAAPGES